jgi:hypothetical protein
MTMKDILLLVLVLVMVTISFFLNYFWGSTIHALQKAVALNVVSPADVAKYAAAICAMHFRS